MLRPAPSDVWNEARRAQEAEDRMHRRKTGQALAALRSFRAGRGNLDLMRETHYRKQQSYRLNAEFPNLEGRRTY